MAGSRAWWIAKVRQFRAQIGARVSKAERRDLETWTTPSQRALFDAMHVADRRHGLDVVTALRAQRVENPEVLVAGLLHDAAKGDAGVLPRIVHALGQANGHRVTRLAGIMPGLAVDLERLRTHAEASASLAAAAGCTLRTVELIRWQEAPRDPEFGEQLRLADEAN